MKKLTLALAIAALIAPLAAEAQPTSAGGRTPKPIKKESIPEGVGTIQYDPGAPADTLLGQTGPSVTVGNRFSSRNGNPLSPGSVSGFSLYLDNAQTTGGLVAFWGPPTAGGGAPALGSFGLTGLANGTFNAFALTPVNFGTDFMGGLYVNSGQPSRGMIGMRSASTNGQGYHAMQISFGGGSGANYQSLPGSNAMFRVSGSIIVPVELQEFDIE